MSKLSKKFYNYINEVTTLNPVQFYAKLTKPNKLIHVGAHLAQERVQYKEIGFKQIFWIEANPEVFINLSTIVGPDNCAIGLLWSRSGEIKSFSIANNSVSSSVYNFADNSMFRDLHMTREMRLTTVTLDDLIATRSIPSELLNDTFLVLDVQGSELEVLRGASDSIQSMNGISVEISRKPVYDGGATVTELDELLKRYQFKMVAAFADSVTGHGDALYISKSIHLPFRYFILGRSMNLFFYLLRVLKSLDRRGIIGL